MPRLPIEFHFITHGLSPVQLVFGEGFAEFLETSIVMISDVGVGLTQLLGNLCERVDFKEVQLKRLSLILCEVLYDFLPSVPAEEPFNAMIVVCSLIVALRTF